MGEIADDLIDGACCEVCGGYFKRPVGYPATCTGCGGDCDEEML